MLEELVIRLMVPVTASIMYVLKCFVPETSREAHTNRTSPLRAPIAYSVAREPKFENSPFPPARYVDHAAANPETVYAVSLPFASRPQTWVALAARGLPLAAPSVVLVFVTRSHFTMLQFTLPYTVVAVFEKPTSADIHFAQELPLVHIVVVAPGATMPAVSGMSNFTAVEVE